MDHPFFIAHVEMRHDETYILRNVIQMAKINLACVNSAELGFATEMYDFSLPTSSQVVLTKCLQQRFIQWNSHAAPSEILAKKLGGKYISNISDCQKMVSFGLTNLPCC